MDENSSQDSFDFEHSNDDHDIDADLYDDEPSENPEVFAEDIDCSQIPELND